MIDQLSIPYARGNAASKAAAERVRPHVTGQRLRVLRVIAERGPLTDNDGITHTGMVNAWRARRGELHKLGLIERVPCADPKQPARWVATYRGRE